MREIPLPDRQGGENTEAVLSYRSLYPHTQYPDLATAVTGYDPRLLANAVFWLAHGDGGRPLLSRTALELALAGGLLAELALARKIYFRPGPTSGLADLVGICWEAAPGVGEYDYDREA